MYAILIELGLHYASLLLFDSANVLISFNWCESFLKFVVLYSLDDYFLRNRHGFVTCYSFGSFWFSDSISFDFC